MDAAVVDEREFGEKKLGELLVASGAAEPAGLLPGLERSPADGACEVLRFLLFLLLFRFEELGELQVGSGAALRAKGFDVINVTP